MRPRTAHFNDMTTSPQSSRRAVIRGAAWTVPVVAFAATAPAFAASPVSCAPTGFRTPGKSDHTTDYHLRTNCSLGQPVMTVVIDAQQAQPVDDAWVIHDRPDSRSTLPVTVNTADGGTWTGQVKFPPSK